MNFSDLRKDKLFFWSNNSLLLAVFLQGLTLAFFYRLLPPQLPLFFSRPWGKEQLADKNIFILLPILLLLTGLINVVFANFFYLKEKLLARIFLAANILLALLLTVTYFKILWLMLF